MLILKILQRHVTGNVAYHIKLCDIANKNSTICSPISYCTYNILMHDISVYFSNNFNPMLSL